MSDPTPELHVLRARLAAIQDEVEKNREEIRFRERRNLRLMEEGSEIHKAIAKLMGW